MEQLVDRRGSRFFLWSTSFLFFLLLLFGSSCSPLSQRVSQSQSRSRRHRRRRPTRLPLPYLSSSSPRSGLSQPICLFLYPFPVSASPITFFRLPPSFACVERKPFRAWAQREAIYATVPSTSGKSRKQRLYFGGSLVAILDVFHGDRKRSRR